MPRRGRRQWLEEAQGWRLGQPTRIPLCAAGQPVTDRPPAPTCAKGSPPSCSTTRLRRCASSHGYTTASIYATDSGAPSKANARARPNQLPQEERAEVRWQGPRTWSRRCAQGQGGKLACRRDARPGQGESGAQDAMDHLPPVTEKQRVVDTVKITRWAAPQSKILTLPVPDVPLQRNVTWLGGRTRRRGGRQIAASPDLPMNARQVHRSTRATSRAAASKRRRAAQRRGRECVTRSRA